VPPPLKRVVFAGEATEVDSLPYEVNEKNRSQQVA
jgi:hypothetical protein